MAVGVSEAGDRQWQRMAGGLPRPFVASRRGNILDYPIVAFADLHGQREELERLLTPARTVRRLVPEASVATDPGRRGMSPRAFDRRFPPRHTGPVSGHPRPIEMNNPCARPSEP